jgi:hypothetical protein
MDSYVDAFQAAGGSMIMIGKGNRSPMVRRACKKHGGFYLGSIGGVAATLSSNSIKKVEVLDMEELGMEAVWKIEVEKFPAFIIIDDKGNDFFKQFSIDNVEVHSYSVYNEFPEIFSMIDQSKDGRIQPDELVRVLGYHPADAMHLVAKHDTAKIGALDIDQFLVAYSGDTTLRDSVSKMYHARKNPVFDDEDED